MEPYHEHNGTDQPQINPKNLLGFPILSEAPTHKANEGTVTFASFNGFIFEYVMFNAVWTIMGIGSAFSDTGTLTLGGGTPITSVISNTGNLNFGAIAPNSAADLTLGLTGTVIGDTIAIGIDDAVISTGTNCTNITFFAWVSAADTVTIRCLNNDAALTANPANGAFRVTTIKF